MEVQEIEEALLGQWETEVEARVARLERYDQSQIKAYNSWESLQALLNENPKSGPTERELAMLMPSLLKLKTFANHWLPKLGPNITSSPIWNFACLTIKLLLEEEAAISCVAPMIREVCSNLGMLNSCLSSSDTFSSELKECSLESGIALLEFLSDIVKLLRHGVRLEHFSAPGDLAHSKNVGWETLDGQINETIHRIKDLSCHSEVLVQFAFREKHLNSKKSTSEGLDSTTSHPIAKGPVRDPMSGRKDKTLSSTDNATISCVILPSRTSHFFNRTDLIDKMEEFFAQTDLETQFSSLALHGLGGVGKSTIALKYAEKKIQNQEIDATFWIYSEKLVSLRQSFTDVALRLKLFGAHRGDDEENHVLVLDWLRNTESRWLMVYDNAVDIRLIQQYWPISSRGQVIITTRNPAFGLELADRGMEIPNWSNEQGLAFLLHLLGTEIGEELGDEEITSVQHLSQKLGGHALAISVMAGLIHKRALTVTEFVKFYEQYPAEVHGISGNRSINALWEISFQSLPSDSLTILAVMSFLEPENIPQELFEVESSDDLPHSLRLYLDLPRFTEALQTLHTLSLVKRNRASRTFSLHRLVQKSFKHFMTFEQKQSSFRDAAFLVAKAFPRRDTEVATLYLLWDRCATYLQHVINLKDCFREEKMTDARFAALPVYCDLNNMCQRYLLERNNHAELEDLMAVNTMALESMSQEQQATGLWASLTSHRGQLLIILGKTDDGVEWLERSYYIRSQDDPFNPRESTWAAVNAAMGIATANNFLAALEWHRIARGHFASWAESQNEKEWDLPADTTCSYGTILFWNGQKQEGRDAITKALRLVEADEPFSWAVAAYVHFALGNVERHDLRYDAAESHYMQAQNLWLEGDQMRSDPFNGSCMYRLGCVALDRGSVEAAIKHLRDALFVTDIRKHTMVAEHARVLFKLSEALEQDPRSGEEAIAKRDEAERLVRSRKMNVGAMNKELAYDRLVCIEWR